MRPNGALAYAPAQMVLLLLPCHDQLRHCRDRGLHAAVGGGALGAALAARRAAREHEGASSGTRSCIVAVSAAVRRHLLLLCMRVYASLLQAQPADTHVNAPREQGTDVP